MYAEHPCAQIPGVSVIERELAEAIKPFADFYVPGAPDAHIITQGSFMAKRQLTMGDCRQAHDLLYRLRHQGVLIDG